MYISKYGISGKFCLCYGNQAFRCTHAVYIVDRISIPLKKDRTKNQSVKWAETIRERLQFRQKMTSKSGIATTHDNKPVLSGVRPFQISRHFIRHFPGSIGRHRPGIGQNKKRFIPSQCVSKRHLVPYHEYRNILDGLTSCRIIINNYDSRLHHAHLSDCKFPTRIFPACA